MQGNAKYLQKRDSSLDVLRCIAMISIIVAHTVQDRFVLQLRSFDVPLMVFLSGLCYKGTRNGYLQYVWKRFCRLVIPTWIFLGLYFLMIWLLGQPIPGRTALTYITFQTDWYVWIIRVFFSIALVSPLIVWCGDRCGKAGFWVVATALLVELTYLTKLSSFKIYQYFLISLGYTVFFYFGHSGRRFTKKKSASFPSFQVPSSWESPYISILHGAPTFPLMSINIRRNSITRPTQFAASGFYISSGSR